MFDNFEQGVGIEGRVCAEYAADVELLMPGCFVEHDLERLDDGVEVGHGFIEHGTDGEHAVTGRHHLPVAVAERVAGVLHQQLMGAHGGLRVVQGARLESRFEVRARLGLVEEERLVQGGRMEGVVGGFLQVRTGKGQVVERGLGFKGAGRERRQLGGHLVEVVRYVVLDVVEHVLRRVRVSLGRLQGTVDRIVVLYVFNEYALASLRRSLVMHQLLRTQILIRLILPDTRLPRHFSPPPFLHLLIIIIL